MWQDDTRRKNQVATTPSALEKNEEPLRFLDIYFSRFVRIIKSSYSGNVSFQYSEEGEGFTLQTVLINYNK